MPGAIVPRWRQRLALLIAAILSLGAAAAARHFLRLLRIKKALEDRRKARRAARPGIGPDDDFKVQWLVLLCEPSLPDVAGGGAPADPALEALLERMRGDSGCRMQFAPFGSCRLGREALLSLLGRPDHSAGFTHCFCVLADDVLEMKLHLHGKTHMSEWFAFHGPRLYGGMGFMKGTAHGGLVDVHTDLLLDYSPEGKADPLVMFALLRFQPYVTEDSDLFAQLRGLVEALSAWQAATSCCLAPLGAGPFVNEDLKKELVWPDSSGGFNHLFTVAADSPDDLKALQASDGYAAWLKAELPHLSSDGGHLPACVFYSPLRLAETAS